MITDDILYLGVNDREIDLFEGQYVVPNGISYNSYVILDDKIAVMDTVDERKKEDYLANLEGALGGKSPDYLVVSHVEPDHASSIDAFLQKYPDTRLVGNAKTFQMLALYFDRNFDNALVVKEGDTLSLGKHVLHFIMTPMVHWPEVMFTYDNFAKVLFSADAFGKFGALDVDEDWTDEARRYYFNIVGKYGAQVQALLKKAATLDIKMICPLHGPILKENLSYYIDKYDIWSSYEPEDDGVFIACASIHGNTLKVAEQMAEILKEKGAKNVAFADLSRDDMAEAIEDAFRYDKIILAAASYDAGVFFPMQDFLNHLKSKNYQNRKVGIIENGSWGPTAARCMKEILEQMKNISICEQVVTIKSTMKEADVARLDVLAEEILK